MPGAMNAADPSRTRLIKIAHVGARELGLDEEGRRAMQARLTGKSSCAAMTSAELERVIAELKRIGFRPRRRRGSDRGDRLPDGPHRGKLWALWMSAWHLGVTDTPNEAGLISFVKRQTGIDAAKWARSPLDSNKTIEGLKAWLAREAGVDWSPYAGPEGKPIDNPRARVLEAQWRILARLGVVRIDDPGALSAYAARHAGIRRTICHTHLDGRQAGNLIRHFGGRIRRARAASAP